ncbi:alpha/beta hydrolase [Couchioplanes caeruleus]|uniref:alpha/beta hydrolase family protein n=1 Tax=Couchioplanes caeruleus TaxID=56438 RepID=UPI0020BE2195|nr:alpha/beta hydrolase [Couchioplanes caeruleus]UQU66922.1 alpha/beta hydrolase [Couchioplanes caeruleus]
MPMKRALIAVTTTVALVLALVGPARGSRPPGTPGAERAAVPATDCTAHVGYHQDADLPGYAVPGAGGSRVCVPFTWIDWAPAGYRGDYRVREFSFAAAERRLDACKADPACTALSDVAGYRPAEFRSTGEIVGFGKVDPYASNLDLTRIRRPGFFARAPYAERIAAAEPQAWTVEFTVPAEPYEVINRGITTPVRLRGWYLRGDGVRDPSGRRTRALAVLLGGRTIETTAVQDPADPLYLPGAAGGHDGVAYPSRGTEKWGARQWREYLDALRRAGFDVLTVDKRGHGISGGHSADNTLQQGLDMLRMVDALADGDGVRALGPDRVTRTGRDAVRRMTGAADARTMPILLGGASQGAYATQWAMDANLHRWCALDTPGRPCSPPWGHRNIRGALLLSTLWGMPFGDPGDLVYTAAHAEVNHSIYTPTSEPLAGIGDWPAVFIGKGIWDEYEGPLGVFSAYQRSAGRAELVLVRGPHSENEHGTANVAVMRDRLVRFAVRAVTGTRVAGPRYATLRDAIAASPPTWEPSTTPTPVG